MSALEPIARVAFHEAVNLPGMTPKGKQPVYPRTDDVVMSAEYPADPNLLRRDRYNLFFDARVGMIIIEHPQSKERERVPMSKVKQMRWMSELGVNVVDPKGKAA